MAATKKYGPAAGKSVEREMKAMNAGTLKTSSGETVTNPKQAIAIGLSEARRAGAKMPPAPGDQETPTKKAGAEKSTTAKKSTAKKSTAAKKSSAAKKSTAKSGSK